MSRRLAAAAALALAAAPAAAWVRSADAAGLCVWWSTRQVHYVVNDLTVHGAASVCSSSPAPPGPAAAAIAAVERSFATWSPAGACSDMRLVLDGLTPSTATGFDCQNLVVFRRGPCGALVPAGDPCRLWDVNGGATVSCADLWNCWDTDDPSHADSRVIALTTVTSARSSGEILDADVELNAWPGSGPQPPGFYFTCVDSPPAPLCSPSPPFLPAGCISIDLQSVVTHEAGHVLGLGHSLDPTATMYPTTAPGETTQRTLAADDVSGLCAIYPAGLSTSAGPQPGVCSGSGTVALRPSSACRPSSCQGCGTAGPGAAGAEGWLGLAALLAWRRRRARPGSDVQQTTAPA